MTRMIPYTRLLLDESPDALRGPELGVIAIGFRTPFQRTFDSLKIAGIQAGLATRPPRMLQGTLAPFGQCPCPPVHRLAVNTHTPSDLGFGQPLREQLCGLKPSPLQRLEIPFHAGWMTHASSIPSSGHNVTILGEHQ